MAVLTFGIFDALKYQKLVRIRGKVVPEDRLYAALFGSGFVPIGLFVSRPQQQKNHLSCGSQLTRFHRSGMHGRRVPEFTG